jgi:hypothetical protein
MNGKREVWLVPQGVAPVAASRLNRQGPLLYSVSVNELSVR